MRSSPADRLWTVTGLAGILLGLGGIAGAIVVAPWFTWTGHALSDLGHPSRASAALFNPSLVTAGLLGVTFTVRLFVAGDHPVERLGIGIVGVGMANMGLVGVFDITHPVHGPVAVAFFLGITYGWFLHGSGMALAGSVRRGIGYIWLGIGHVTAWLLWAVVDLDGIALPEIAGSLLLAVWIVDVTRSLETAELSGQGSSAIANERAR
ncbi:MAG: DUF998 domain-containing protein [Halanaeroarchaeum sp.]